MASPKPAVRKGQKLYTYGDYVTWPDEGRWEILEGEVFDMTPCPTDDHQRVLRRLATRIENFLEGKSCELFFAPFDVLLPKADEPDEEVINVLQPDLMVVCDSSKVSRKGVRGAPDFVIEILSPSTASKDQVRKRRLYERHGVREFWTIDPINRIVMVYRRDAKGKAFRGPDILSADDLALEVGILPGLIIDFGKVMPQPPRIVGQPPAVYST